MDFGGVKTALVCELENLKISIDHGVPALINTHQPLHSTKNKTLNTQKPKRKCLAEMNKFSKLWIYQTLF